MPIETSFSFQQLKDVPFPANPGLIAEFRRTDLLGMLRGFVGLSKTRSWSGKGFNLLWRPHFGGTKDFFLQLMFTDETLDFTDITGSGIANRGLKQSDVLLGGAAYLQQVKDSFDHTDQHFEPGVWTNVPATTSPSEQATVARMGSIPHGTTINLQGHANVLNGPDMNKEIPVTFIKPFSIGSKDDGATGVIAGAFDAEQSLAQTANVSRTDLARVKTLTQAELTDPNLILRMANAGLTFQKVVKIQIASDPALIGAVPDTGGGTRNIAFLSGKDANSENADVLVVSATFWLQEATDQTGKTIHQLQYSQRVLMNFSGLSWPHISLGTLRSI